MEEEGKFSNINDDQRGELLKQNQNSWYIPFSPLILFAIWQNIALKYL